MIQLVVNTNMLREIDERRLINIYARLVYFDEEDITNDFIIQENLKSILDWDIRGDNGLGIYCSKFEDLKKVDWKVLVDFIKDNGHEIRKIALPFTREKKSDIKKEILTTLESKENHNIERFTDENYQVSGRGKKAKPCVYKGRYYKSRKECQYKEKLSHSELYKYLARTNQLEPDSFWNKYKYD